MSTVQVRRGQIFDATEAGKRLGLPGNLVRQWIRMGLLTATKVGITYAIKAEDLAYASARYYGGYFTDVPRPRNGAPINYIELV